jgi:ABC-type branched-subunit amino acid transport system substrate-binding protein
MRVTFKASVRATAAVVTVVLVGAGLAVVGATGAGASVRGFDGSTITVAGLGISQQLPKTEVGAQARIKRFNDTNELKGIKIKWAEMANDNQDPATALSEARRLVTQVGVFALVGDISANNPATYLAQQKVPYFGGGFDTTYCSNQVSTKVWGFSDGGCIVPQSPSRVSDVFHAMYTYVSKAQNTKTPSFVVIGNDNDSGKNGARIFTIQAQGTGFRVLPPITSMPSPNPPNDYSPYATALMKADNGKAPDSLFCEAQAIECLGLYQFMHTAGYKGVFEHGIWTNALVKPFDGSVINNPTVNPLEKNPGMDQLKADLEAFKPGSSADVDFGAIVGYTTADMFIQALKAVAKKGKSNITPENIQKYASTMTWELRGVQGPIQYPTSTVDQFPACFSNYLSNGTQWTTAVPYSCSTKTYPPTLKKGAS